MEHLSRRQNITLIVLFLILIFVPTGISILKPETGFSEKENRVLKKMPDINAEDVFDGTFSREYETYLSDQFFLRDEWIGMKTAVERKLGKQETKDIYFAKDGYLIEKHSKSFDTPMAHQNLKTLASFLETQMERLGAGHVKAILVPNAVDILKDKLPPFAVSVEEEEYLKEARQVLPDGTFMDAGSVLKEHKEEELYYRTDHHWKTLGARYVYEAWAEEIGLSIAPASDYEIQTLTTDFYGTVDAKVSGIAQGDSIEAYMPLHPTSYSMVYNHDESKVKTSLYEMEYLKGRDKYGVFFGSNQPLIEITTTAKSDRKLLILKDSYANCFVPFALQDFAAVDMVDLRYFNESLKDFMETKEYTDVCVLYNVSGFAEDSSIVKLGI